METGQLCAEILVAQSQVLSFGMQDVSAAHCRISISSAIERNKLSATFVIQNIKIIRENANRLRHKIQLIWKVEKYCHCVYLFKIMQIWTRQSDIYY